MVGIGILGYGTVGSGVYEVLKVNKDIIKRKTGEEIKVKKVLDLRSFPGDNIESILTHDFEDILNDDSINIIAEVMGGIEPAFTYSKLAIEKGKSVVTSNKALVAEKGPELLKLAEKYNVNYLFEASCGGTIPIIRPLNTSLTSDDVQKIEGILNGTTNFILTKMTEEGRDFEDVLKEAQKLGYAEADPTADVEGHDSCRKIAILSSVAFGATVNYKDIHTEGITKITSTDIQYAKKLNCVIKLIAESEKTPLGIAARVVPCLIKSSHPLATVNNAYNAIFVKGNMSGETMYYGSGAGKLPTAAAVVGDIIDIVKMKGLYVPIDWNVNENMPVLSPEKSEIKAFIRIGFENKENAEKAVSDLFGNVDFTSLEGLNNEFAFITGQETEKSVIDKVNKLKNASAVKEIFNVIHVEE